MKPQFIFIFRTLKEQLLTIALSIPILSIITLVYLVITLLIYRNDSPEIKIFLELFSCSYSLFFVLSVLPENYCSKLDIYFLKKFGLIDKNYDNIRAYSLSYVPILFTKLILYFGLGHKILITIITEDNQHWDYIGITMMIFILLCFPSFHLARFIIDSSKLKEKFDRKTIII